MVDPRRSTDGEVEARRDARLTEGPHERTGDASASQLLVHDRGIGPGEAVGAQREDPGLEHQSPAPEGVLSPEEALERVGASRLHPLSRRLISESPIEVVHAEGAIYEQVPGPHVPQQNVWFRTRRTIGDDPALHRAVLAYMSDLTIQESVLRAHGVAWAQPGLKVASLDHAMWWHRRARVDEWLLYAQESPSARGGRGLATGRIFTRDGDLVATVAQEIMVRVPDASDAAPAGEA